MISTFSRIWYFKKKCYNRTKYEFCLCTSITSYNKKKKATAATMTIITVIISVHQLVSVKPTLIKMEPSNVTHQKKSKDLNCHWKLYVHRLKQNGYMWKTKTGSFNNLKSHSHELDPENAQTYFSYQKSDGEIETRTIQDSQNGILFLPNFTKL